MLLKEIFKLAIMRAMEADPRGQDRLEKVLKERKEAYDKMDEEEKQEYDKDRLWNPYDDSRLLYGDPELDVKTVLSGIDIDTSEILLADRLNNNGDKIDAIIAHHPEGVGLAKLYEVMHLQGDMLHDLGVPVNIAEGMLSDRIEEVERALLPVNHNKAVDAAALLGIPLMSMHTPADNCVTKFLNDWFESASIDKVKDVVKRLKELPEYAKAVQINAGPKIVSGSESRRAGKVVVDMTGGTSGSEDAYERLADAGVGTIVGMHMKDKHREKAKKYHINVIIAGHIASDSLGMNLILDEMEKRGVNIKVCSGLTRISRVE